MLGQCSSLASLFLESNNIGSEGARSLASMLLQCTSLESLSLAENYLDDVDKAMLRALWPGDALDLWIFDQRSFSDDDSSEEEEASDFGDGSSQESGQESDDEESWQESEAEENMND